MEVSPQSLSAALSRGLDVAFNSFSPGSHRRSHPNLHHLSFAPLAPKYPVSPSDYNQYVDPTTNTLHSSASLSHITDLPSSPGLLSVPTTPGGSRSVRSSHGTRRIKSNVQFDKAGARINPSLPSGAVTSAGLGGKVSSNDSSTRKSTINMSDPSWLIQTGLHLTDSSRESKGQSWLSKRASSTSLHGLDSPSAISRVSGSHYFMPGDINRPSRSTRVTPASSRRQSRNRAPGTAKRRDLKMTSMPPNDLPPLMTSPQAISGEAPTTSADPSSTRNKIRSFASMQPNWTDPITQAEALAETEIDLQSIYQSADEDLFSDVDDGTLDDEYQDAKEAEREIQAQVKAGRGFILGRWVDNVVDTLLMLEDEGDGDQLDNDDDSDNRAGQARLRKEVAQEERQDLDASSGARTGTKVAGRQDAAEVEETETDPLADMETPPENPTSVWDDVKYVGKLIWNTPVL